MKQIRIAIGRLILLCGWPALWVYFWIQPSRTRVVVVWDGKILLIRSWIGSGRIGLPGGGLHRNENEVMGAIRELQEETGIVVAPHELSKFLDINKGDYGFTYAQHCYYVVLKNEPVITLQPYEIIDYSWQGFDDAIAMARGSTVDILQAFSQKANFDTL